MDTSTNRFEFAPSYNNTMSPSTNYMIISKNRHERRKEKALNRKSAKRSK